MKKIDFLLIFLKNFTKNLLKQPGSYLKLKIVLKITKKHPYISWVFFTELKNVLKFDEKPPETFWVFFDIEKCANHVFKKPPKSFWFFFTELKNVLKLPKNLLIYIGSYLQNQTESKRTSSFNT